MPKEISPMNGLKFPLKETSEGDFLNAEEPTGCNCVIRSTTQIVVKILGIRKIIAGDFPIQGRSSR
jgi:hypothetical protein